MTATRRLTLTPDTASLLDDVLGYYKLADFGGQTHYAPHEEEPREQFEHREAVVALAERVGAIHDRFTEEVSV